MPGACPLSRDRAWEDQAREDRAREDRGSGFPACSAGAAADSEEVSALWAHFPLWGWGEGPHLDLGVQCGSREHCS